MMAAVPSAAGERTRGALIRAAEKLMARRGIEAVDLKDIQAAASQKNRSAVNYHFKDRVGLVAAIVDKHRVPINAARHRLLDRMERNGNVDVPHLVEALVMPLAKSLETPSGRDYILIIGEAAVRLGIGRMFQAREDSTDSIHRVSDLLVEAIEGPRPEREWRVNHVILLSPILLSDIARDINRGKTTVPHGKRTARQVVTFLTGAVVAPAGQSNAVSTAATR